MLTDTTLHLFSAVLTFVLPILTLVYVHSDYKAFISLGPGGTPATPLGYAKIKLLSVISLRDPLRPLPVPTHFRPQRGYLSTLATRAGERPAVRGIAPQRQQTQRSTAEVYAGLVGAMRRLVGDPANCLVERTSCFEKHSSGLFATVSTCHSLMHRTCSLMVGPDAYNTYVWWGSVSCSPLRWFPAHDSSPSRCEDCTGERVGREASIGSWGLVPPLRSARICAHLCSKGRRGYRCRDEDSRGQRVVGCWYRCREERRKPEGFRDRCGSICESTVCERVSYLQHSWLRRKEPGKHDRKGLRVFCQ